MEQFKLQHLQIDVPRCQITNQGKITSVEPRSMAVLAYLAARPKQVISQQELFDKLWPDTVFNPGAIGRCIAQLRKAIGDDARHPVFIATHSKRGYSLEVSPTNGGLPRPKNHIKPWFSAVIVLCIAVLMSSFYFKNEQKVFSGQLTPITSTSHYDFMPSYSSDGKTLAFIRQNNGQGYIYLKDLSTGTERQITKQSDNFSSLAWHDNNRSLLFIINQHNSHRVGQIVIDQKQTTELFRLEGPGDIWRILPAEKGLYYMLANVPLNQKPDTQIKYYDFATKVHSQVLASSDDFTPYRIALSADKQGLAIAGESPENKIEFRLLDLKTQELSMPFASLPLGFTEINWHPNGQSLLVHHLNKLYSLNLEGEFAPLPYNHFQRLFNPVYHADGRKILMSVTEYDTDIMGFNSQTQELNILIDSDGEDHLARVSPDVQKLAYVTSRSGTQQVYIRQQDNDHLLFNNPDNLPIYRAPVWSKRGDQLAFSFANKLYIYHVKTNSLNQLTMPDSFTSVLDWYSDDNRLLVATKKDNISYFSHYSLDTHEIVGLLESGVNYAARLSAKDELVFMKDRQLYWGERIFNLDGLANVSREVFPVGNKVIFTAGQKIYQFDGNKYQVLLNELPADMQTIADVIDEQNFVFYSNSAPSAKIVALE